MHKKSMWLRAEFYMELISRFLPSYPWIATQMLFCSRLTLPTSVVSKIYMPHL
jgi:hypothetical protein